MRREMQPLTQGYYHPSRHSAGQPIVAGWVYRFVAQPNCRVRELDRARERGARPSGPREANAVATEPVEALLSRLGEGETAPSFVFEDSYDPAELQRGLEGLPSQVLVRLRWSAASTATRVSLVRPHRTAAPPRAQDEGFGSLDLAQALGRAHARGRRSRDGARADLLEAAPEGPQPRGAGQP
jgi:hypothetical protein